MNHKSVKSEITKGIGLKSLRNVLVKQRPLF
jgi:hypothetical protein